MQGKEQNNYEFIKEKRKERPVNKKRMLIHTGFVVAMAVVFGVIASFVMAFLQPKLEDYLYPKENPTVSIPTDEPTEIISSEVETEVVNTEDNQPIDIIDWQPTIEDLQMLQNQLYAVGRQSTRFMVTVTGVQNSTDWFDNAYESQDKGSGIIVANNGQELMILTEKRIISDAKEVFVTFKDNTRVKASLKQYDGNTGIAILSVALSEIGIETIQEIAIASLGNSLALQPGTLAIAVGNPQGVDVAILTGTVTSTTNTISSIDANYRTLTTDMSSSRKGSGALLNVKGEVIGLVMQDFSRQGDEHTLTAIAISDLKMLIENLSNNKEMAYLGLGISSVTSEMEKEYEIPRGVYIREVKMDSPAMNAGLQSADVIVEMDGEGIYSEEAYERKMLELRPGDKVRVIIKRQGAEGYVSIRCDVEASKLE